MSSKKRKTKLGREHLVIPDTQVKDGVNTDHLEALGNYILEKRPDVIVHLGDHWDMPSLATSYHKRGDAYFEGKRYSKDIAAGHAGMERLIAPLRKARAKGYRPEMYFLEGNHEQRVRRLQESEPTLSSVVGPDDFAIETYGWKFHPFLEPVCIDGVWYAHYFYQQKTGRPYGGMVQTRLKNIGFSFTQGHQQGLDYAHRELANGRRMCGLVAGSFYSHEEEYRGPQATNEYRGIVYCHEVHDGQYDLMMVSLDYLTRVWR